MGDDASEPAAVPSTDRTLLAILIAVGLLIAVAIIVVAVRSTGPTTLDPTTPEGVVQAYAIAVIADDDATAAEYLASTSDDCGYYDRSDDEVRLTLRSTRISGDTATVSVTVTTSYGYGGGPFTSSEYSYDTEFTLIRDGASWLVQDAPYEFVSCGIEAG